MKVSSISFRPLIRGFFFYVEVEGADALIPSLVSVPSFGDSFFMQGNILTIRT